ncbi:GntR family transcriptional regulator [Embleya sp. NPDC001921]
MAEWSGTPAYEQVADELRQRIAGMKPGDKLPSLPKLQEEFGVSVTVIRMALAELRHEGRVVTHQGKGAFVADSALASQTGKRGTTDLEADLREMKKLLKDLQQRVSVLETKSQESSNS